MALAPGQPQQVVDAYNKLIDPLLGLGREPTLADHDRLVEQFGLPPSEVWMDLVPDGIINVLDIGLLGAVIANLVPDNGNGPANGNGAGVGLIALLVGLVILAVARRR